MSESNINTLQFIFKKLKDAQGIITSCLISQEPKKEIFDLLEAKLITKNIPQNLISYDLHKNEILKKIEKGNMDIIYEYDSFNVTIFQFLKKSNVFKDFKLMKHIIDYMDFNSFGKHRKFPIHFICEYATPEIIQYTVQKCVDLEVKDELNERPIHYICRYSTPSMIRFFIEQKVDLECENIYKERPIHIICEYSTFESIQLIIEQKVDLECENINKERPIHIICTYSTPESIQLIIDQGVELESEDIFGRTPFHILCRYSTRKMIKYIMKKGVNIHCKTKSGTSAFELLLKNK